MVKVAKWILLSLSILLVSCQAAHRSYYMYTSFHEPAVDGLRYLYSKDGLHWDSIPGVWLKPEVGEQKVLRDPSIAMGTDGVFRLVWTSSWKGDLGFGYASSRDLKHWSEQKFIPVMKNEPTAVNTWAPEVFYDDEKKDFVVVWASCIPGRFPKGLEDEDNNHRLYYITTKDFVNISDTKLFYDPGFSAIDATIVKRKKNDYVLVLKDNTRPNRNLKVAFATSATGPYSKASETFTHGYVEGPTVVKLKDEYYIYYDAYQMKVFGASKTKDFVHFEDASSDIYIPPFHKHGTIFKAPASVVKGLKQN